MPDAKPFDVYPAIDLRQGQVVRLRQGDPDRQTTYSRQPARIARDWINAGARWLHVVNLDGAFDQDSSANWIALEAILDASARHSPGCQVQFGGGLRSLAVVEQVLAMGVRRAVLGTVAVESPELLSQALARCGPDALAIGIDARDGRVQVHGWTQDSEQSPLELAQTIREAGLHTAIYTNVRRDGMGAGVDVQGALEITRQTGLSVIASGGVRSLEDIRSVRAAGLRGVIIGRALYQGEILLEAALQC